MRGYGVSCGQLPKVSDHFVVPVSIH